MQFVHEPRSAKKLARALERFLSKKGIRLSHGQALDALAAMQGFADWNSLAASLKPEAVDALLRDFEKDHLKRTLDATYGQEGELRTHTGFALRFPVHPEECSYVRVVDPIGREIAYWVEDEWRESPAEVMGALIGALTRGNALTPKAPRKRTPEPKGLQLEQPFRLYVGTYSTIDRAYPQWAMIEVSQEFLEELLRLRALVQSSGVDRVQKWGSPQWSEGQECVDEDDDEEVALRMDVGMLVVESDRFWYEARPKHADEEVETAGVDIEDLLKVLAGEKVEGFIHYGNDIVMSWSDTLVDTLLDDGVSLRDFPQSKRPRKPEYDGSYWEKHCPECGEYESECICKDEDASEEESGSGK